MRTPEFDLDSRVDGRNPLLGGALPGGLAERIARNRLTRRDALALLAVAGGAPALAALSGCATSPVTGKQIMVGMSEGQEVEVDLQHAPHQFSQDLGAVQDDAINQYVTRVGDSLDSRVHRQQVPYNYRVLNANYVNAYTFPGGSVGVTRAIMTEMQSEAQLAALLGHELGHVNARHAAQRQGQAMIGQAALVGLNIAVASSNQAQWGPLVGLASQIGASALLSAYSREHEREADALGQQYMVNAGYPASGMTDLHGMLLRQHGAKPSLLQTMFSSHPMPAERVETAKQLAATTYASSAEFDVQRERYMDSTARLRALRPTIDACQRGEMAGAKKDLPGAEREFSQAVRLTPNDYAANVLMAQCLVAQKRYDDAQRYADQAKSIYPREAQAHKLAGIARLASRDPAAAFRDLDRFDRLLPGDRGVQFLKGVSLEQQGQREAAARHYAGFVRAVPEGGASSYAMSRLQSWGYVR